MMMTMICKQCGAKLFAQENGVFTCAYCRTEYRPQEPALSSLSPADESLAGLGWKLETLRALLVAGFSNSDLETICFDSFRAVYDDFAPGMAKPDKIQRLLQYCQQHKQFDKLLKVAKGYNPHMYAKFERENG